MNCQRRLGPAFLAARRALARRLRSRSRRRNYPAGDGGTAGGDNEAAGDQGRELPPPGLGPLPAAADGKARRIVYYNAVLELTQDVNFASWNGLNATAFATLLGRHREGRDRHQAGRQPDRRPASGPRQRHLRRGGRRLGPRAVGGGTRGHGLARGQYRPAQRGHAAARGRGRPAQGGIAQPAAQRHHRRGAGQGSWAGCSCASTDWTA